MSEPILQVKDLTVKTGNRKILKKVNLSIEKGMVSVLFGPNGSGKSTLIRTIMGFAGYEVVSGDILFKGKSVLGLSIDQRAGLGMGIMFQHPPTIRGVKLEQISRFLSKDRQQTAALAGKLNLEQMFMRDINGGLSGGEMKRSELFQLILQNPDLLLLDEPESGVDIENISLMGRIFGSYLKKEKPSCLIITHTGYILDYIRADRGCVLVDGELHCSGASPAEIFATIQKMGYEKCKECHGSL